jgi:hypothetical protein
LSCAQAFVKLLLLKLICFLAWTRKKIMIFELQTWLHVLEIIFFLINLISNIFMINSIHIIYVMFAIFHGFMYMYHSLTCSFNQKYQ